MTEPPAFSGEDREVAKVRGPDRDSGATGVSALGPFFILGGALAAAVALFLPLFGFGGEDWTWWEYANGLDIALLVASVIAAGFALAALITDRPGVRQMAGIGGAATFGLAFAFVPAAVDDSHFYRAGLWIVAGAGGVALVGSVVTTLSAAGRPSRPALLSPRWRLAGIGITGAAVIAFAAMAIADPFGSATREPTNRVPDVNDAAKLTRKWATEHKRPGEKVVRYACDGDGSAFEARWACHVRFEPTRRVMTVYVRTEPNLREQKVVRVREGEHQLPYP